MVKIVFVILHYLAIEETKNCIKSICDNICYNNYYIIVIDNGSMNEEDSIELQTIADNDTAIIYIKLDKNLGFAQGNNVGFKYAKEELQADFIVLLNNDTRIEQRDFCNVVINKYSKYGYAVAGPLIIVKDGSTNSNPMSAGRYILKRQKLALVKMVLCYLLSYIGIDELLTKGPYKNYNSDKNEVHSLKLEKTDVENVKLHGCAMVFAKPYIEKFDGLNPNTFLYMEEDILFVRLRNNHLKSLFTPDLIIYHDEDAATNKVVRSPIKKKRFIYKNQIKSYKALIDEIRDIHA